jgi:hypothetical protein
MNNPGATAYLAAALIVKRNDLWFWLSIAWVLAWCVIMVWIVTY